ncbi:MAG: hypothetical protein GY802_29735 [Gammaproteobacteria bacterium]|nr:hypothetical protein [Gammaproteobacteria bacterium]
MKSRSNEIIKHLNRLANDRSLSPQARNRIRDAAQHIRELQLKLSEMMSEELAEY